MSSVNKITALTRRRRQSLVLTFLVVSVLFAVLSCTKLRDFRDRSREQHQLEDLASLDPIDAHTHIGATSPAFVAMLERLHMHVLDIVYVDDTNPNRASLERQKQDALRFIASANGRATLCTTFDPLTLNDSDFPQVAIEALNQDFAQGAIAAKVWKNIGMEIKNRSGQYVMPDDPTI